MNYNQQLDFTINIAPAGKERARQGRGGRFYTPEQTKGNEQIIRLACEYAMVRQKAKMFPKDMALGARFTAYYPIPKSFSKKKRAQAIDGAIAPVVKPDADNVEKLILDALNKVAYYDDAQICYVEKWKKYGEMPRIELSVFPL